MRHILLITTIGLLATNAYSDTLSDSGKPGEPLTFEQLDTNRDGAITKQEASSFSALEVIFESVDLNKNGLLDSQEYSSVNISTAK